MSSSIPLQNMSRESQLSDTHANPADVKQGLVTKYSAQISKNTTRLQNLNVIGAESTDLGKVLSAQLKLHSTYVDKIMNLNADGSGSKQGVQQSLSKMWATVRKHLDCFKPADTEAKTLKQEKQEIKGLLETDAVFAKTGQDIEKAFATPLATIDNTIELQKIADLQTTVKELTEKCDEQFMGILSAPPETPKNLRLTLTQRATLQSIGASHAQSTDETSAEEKTNEQSTAKTEAQSQEYYNLAESFRQQNSKETTPAPSGSATPLKEYTDTIKTLSRTTTELDLAMAKIAQPPLKPE